MNKLSLVQDAILHFLPDATISWGKQAYSDNYEIRVIVGSKGLLDQSHARTGELHRDWERLVQKDYD